MVTAQLRAKVVLERLSWIRRMQANIRSLPLSSLEDFTANPHIPASAESYLRRCLEALLDLGRHLLAKGFGRAPVEYKAIADELQAVGLLNLEEARLLRQMAGYRNRMVHFYHEINPEELYQICVSQLDDVERVVEALRQWMLDHPERMDETL